jgi:ribosome-binding factor A
MPSRRQERVAKRVMQELVEAFRDLKNADLGFVTVTRCEVSPDLRHAKVYVSVWGDEARRAKTLEELKRNASRLKGIIGRPLATKVVPTLHFEFDETISNADEMSRLIRDARQTDVNPNALTPEEQAERDAAASVSGGVAKSARREGVDVFEAARMDVDEELFGADDDDPDWEPINLDELPEDDDDA